MNIAGQVVRSAAFNHGIHCQELFYMSGSHIATHAHDDPFFTLALEGTFRQDAGGESLECPAHTTLYQAAGHEHSFSAGRENVRCFVLELNSNEIERLYCVRFPQSLKRKSAGEMTWLMTAAYREVRQRDAMSPLAIEALVLQLLVESQRASVERGRPLWLRSVEDLLHDRFRSPLTLAEIAEEVGVPAAHLSAVFRRVHGRTVADEQRRLRVDFASRRMVDSDASLAEIGLESGFADQPHFSRTFKRITGMTPAQYRAMLRPTTSSAST